MFKCQPTYEQQLATLCQSDGFLKQAGTCSSWQVTGVVTPYETSRCAYDESGALVWAWWCADSPVLCGQTCFASAGAPDPLPACTYSLPYVCGTGIDAASD